MGAGKENNSYHMKQREKGIRSAKKYKWDIIILVITVIIVYIIIMSINGYALPVLQKHYADVHNSFDK